MRIVIDMQGAQSSGSRHRGIGRYTLALAQAIIRHRGDHEVLLALNGRFPESIKDIRMAFAGLLPARNIRVWQAPVPFSYQAAENTARRNAAELLRESFLASLKPDIILVSSLFEGLVDDAATSIGVLSRNIPIAVILYDLIPLIHRRPYLDNPIVKEWYENKLDHLRRADLLLSISESSRQEGLQHLAFAEDRVVNISTAADPQFRPLTLSEQEAQKVCSRHHLRRPFVMYTGGIDHRKNIEGLISAYAKLPASLLSVHQLAIVCSVQPSVRTELEAFAKKLGLKDGDVVLTGFVSEDDLIALYNLCKLFVFPSLHEGFGLPALEAMSCGGAVIGSNCSSVPEVIGREDALFDPYKPDVIAAKLEEVLTNDEFRCTLALHGREQAKRFSWDICAQRAIDALERWTTTRTKEVPSRLSTVRPKLAYVSPLPPERSGISDYSAELLPALSCHYDIEVVVAQPEVDDAWIRDNCQIRNVDWFKMNSDLYDRVLYHFGNSPFHQHMFDLLDEIPGVVVLHDFYLSNLVKHMDWTGHRPSSWLRALYTDHGYVAVHCAASADDKESVLWKYPCNQEVLQRALGVIVHAEHPMRLAQQWYGQLAGAGFTVIPLLRVPARDISRSAARQTLKIEADAFVVCSFGLLGPTKLNHRLLKAWLDSSLSRDPRCQLVFVGENPGGEYGADLQELIRHSGRQERIRITGWLSQEMFHTYLAAADVGVQLRSLSRGETSAAVLDCMNYGLATIVNANGSMADLPGDCLWKLVDEFTDAELVEALETLWRDDARRGTMGGRAQGLIWRIHSPTLCANRYADALEEIYREAEAGIPQLIRHLAKIKPTLNDVELMSVADDIAGIGQPWRGSRQLLVDISILVQFDAKTGIQRVVRSLLREMLLNPPPGYRIEPVYATPDQGYRYARRFTMQFLDCPEAYLGLADDPIDLGPDDIFLGLDLSHQVVITHGAEFERMRNRGVQVWFIVYDLLPVLMPEVFAEGLERLHTDWLTVIARHGNAICISRSVADELSAWVSRQNDEQMRFCTIRSFHLGADILPSVRSNGMSRQFCEVLERLRSTQSFLMVGTIEPRKCHAQVLAGFEQLWAKGKDVNLVVVGKSGWDVNALVEKIRNHPQLEDRLFWLEGISDEYLDEIYSASSCLIAASAGEGFGLPLIEAAQHKLPIIARDIPVFREVAGDFAYYFSGGEAQTIASAVEGWLALNSAGSAPQSIAMPWLTWRQSTLQLLDTILP